LHSTPAQGQRGSTRKLQSRGVVRNRQNEVFYVGDLTTLEEGHRGKRDREDVCAYFFRYFSHPVIEYPLAAPGPSQTHHCTEYSHPLSQTKKGRKGLRRRPDGSPDLAYCAVRRRRLLSDQEWVLGAVLASPGEWVLAAVLASPGMNPLGQHALNRIH
jgi:hypothetical protein